MKKVAVLMLAVIATACSQQKMDSEINGVKLTADHLSHPTPYIPPQCYTNPVDQSSEYNPCYACHTESKEPNYLNDVDVQTNYSFPETALKNPWLNVYKDRREELNSISDEQIIQYVRQNNYRDDKGQIILAEKLKDVPDVWDRNKNGQWDGYIPDVYFDFDDRGFDKAPSGEFSGWRVFAYYPFLGTFLPTNGATDDVLIRLPEEFRQNEKGEEDYVIYQVNLAIVEALIKGVNVVVASVDENYLGVDIDKNGELSQATMVRYDWAPLENRNMSYVGAAKLLQESGKVHLAGGLYPEGTEFVHSVRYLDVSSGKTKMAMRMKELRYGRKASWRNYFKLSRIIDKEIKERHDFPDRTKQLIGNMEEGFSLAQGWVYQGFIEDRHGELRPQTYEENYFCSGCHGGVGATADTTFAFGRKFPAGQSFKDGWYHWLEKGFDGVPDRIREDGRGEYEFYLAHNPSGNEFRTNEEVRNKFFNVDGSMKEESFSLLKNDISHLLMPTPERALMLNKAYKLIVEEQSYLLGRDAVIQPLDAVHKEIVLDSETGITEALSYF